MMTRPHDNPSQAGLDDEEVPNAPEPTNLRAEYPCFRIWQEKTCDRVLYVACSLHLELNPHTVVTDDIGELRAALEPSRHAACPRPHPAGQAPSARPLQATAP
jgi:hypothetical protein